MEGGMGPCPLGREARLGASGLLLGREVGKETPEIGATLWAMQAWSAFGPPCSEL